MSTNRQWYKKVIAHGGKNFVFFFLEHSLVFKKILCKVKVTCHFPQRLGYNYHIITVFPQQGYKSV